MTTTARRAGVLTLTLLMTLFMSVVAVTGVAHAQEGEEECYPVPPGGCPTEEPTEEPAEVTCADIIAAIEAGDVELDQNGDGEINAEDLPAECTCEELLDAIARGVIDVEDLADGLLEEACSCDELEEAIAQGVIDESVLPEECIEEEVAEETEEPVADVIAEGGFPTSMAAAFAGAVLLAGFTLLATTRRTG